MRGSNGEAQDQGRIKLVTVSNSLTNPDPLQTCSQRLCTEVSFWERPSNANKESGIVIWLLGAAENIIFVSVCQISRRDEVLCRRRGIPKPNTFLHLKSSIKITKHASILNVLHSFYRKVL